MTLDASLPSRKKVRFHRIWFKLSFLNFSSISKTFSGSRKMKQKIKNTRISQEWFFVLLQWHLNRHTLTTTIINLKTDEQKKHKMINQFYFHSNGFVVLQKEITSNSLLCLRFCQQNAIGVNLHLHLHFLNWKSIILSFVWNMHTQQFLFMLRPLNENVCIKLENKLSDLNERMFLRNLNEPISILDVFFEYFAL